MLPVEPLDLGVVNTEFQVRKVPLVGVASVRQFVVGAILVGRGGVAEILQRLK
jgi:hypothetical protein